MPSKKTPKVPPAPRNLNILSLDGGGVRGVVEAVFLARLMKEYPKFLRDTDLLVGVSTGAIQALGLAAGKEPLELKELYVEGAKYIFQDHWSDDARDLWRILGADYNNRNLRKLLELQFGEKRLSDLNKTVAIVSFLLDNGLKEPTKRAWKPKIFHNAEKNPDADLDASVVEVALRSAAAPVYFPTAGKYIDGGVVANNPAMIGLAQALDRRGPVNELAHIKIFSLGTGKIPRFIPGEDLDWGAMEWAPHILDVLLEGGIDLVHFQCQQILRERYFRLNPLLPQPVKVDEWQKVPELITIAEEYPLSEAVAWLEENWL